MTSSEEFSQALSDNHRFAPVTRKLRGMLWVGAPGLAAVVPQVARIANHDKPDEAYTTDRAVRAGRANACSGKILVTVPGDHFGPIGPEADPLEGKVALNPIFVARSPVPDPFSAIAPRRAPCCPPHKETARTYVKFGGSNRRRLPQQSQALRRSPALRTCVPPF